jgi:hypothetical protein
MTLNLKKAAVAKQSEIDSAEEKLDAQIETIIRDVEKMGVPRAPTVDEIPDDISLLQSNIDTLSDRDLGNIHVKIATFMSYVAYCTAVQKIRYEATDRAADDLEATLGLDLLAKEVPKTEHKTRIAVNGTLKGLRDRTFMEKAKWEMLKARLNGLDSQASALSRLITARGQDANAAGTSSGISNRNKTAAGARGAHAQPGRHLFPKPGR